MTKKFMKTRRTKAKKTENLKRRAAILTVSRIFHKKSKLDNCLVFLETGVEVAKTIIYSHRTSYNFVQFRFQLTLLLFYLTFHLL